MPSVPRLIGATDNCIIPLPTLDQKRAILLNALPLFRGLGLDQVRVAAIAASEKVSDRQPATGDAAALAEESRSGALAGLIVDGPFGYDVALSARAGGGQGRGGGQHRAGRDGAGAAEFALGRGGAAGAGAGHGAGHSGGAGAMIKTVGIVGAGQMGNGIAHVFALAGYDVLLNDISAAGLEKAVATIDRNLERQVTRGKTTAQAKAEAMARIKTTLVLAELGPCDLIIEAATEKEDIKDKIFASLLPHLGPQTILTSNTSSISITRLASRTDRPEKFMGFHFMNPVPIMQLVELIRGIATDKETYDSLLAVVGRLGKTADSAEDFPAFIVNRILMPMINEAVYTLYEGVGSVKSIDESLKLGANHTMGP